MKLSNKRKHYLADIYNYIITIIEKHGVKILYIVISILVIILITYSIHWISVYNRVAENNNQTWINFIASYWGGIIGGLISGMLSIIGTWLIIRYTVKMDYHRQRIEYLPMISLQSAVKTDGILFFVENAYKSLSNIIKPIDLIVNNIGKGVATNVRIANIEEWNEESIKTILEPHIPINIRIAWSDDCAHAINDNKLHLKFLFGDLFGNEYEQEYDIKRVTDIHTEKTELRIESNIPVLIKKTNRIQYTQ